MFLYIFLFLISVFYLYTKWAQSYWQRKGVLYAEPTFLFGSMDVFFKGQHLSKPLGKMYDRAKAEGRKYFGYYEFLRPSFVAVDLDLVKMILQNNFVNFDSHFDLRVSLDDDPLLGHLFNLGGEKWKKLRVKLTPTFTSGKIKMMFETMVTCTGGLEEMLKDSPRNEPVDIKDILGRFTTDIIGSVGFGLDINSMKNPDSEFRKHGKNTFKVTFLKALRIIPVHLLPQWLVQKLGLTLIDHDITTFFINLVEKTVSYREKNNIYRKDFLHLLIQLKNFGKIVDDEKVMADTNMTDVTPGLTINEMAAQCFVFFVAGFETSATTMTFCLLELAQNKKIQDKTRDEIRKVLKKYNNQLTYEAIMEMEYLEQVLSETLRKYPPVGVMPRLCTKDFKVPDSDIIIYKGQPVQIPTYSIQRDPEYYPNPEVFDPERFNPENKANIPSMAYIPFGEGPRICIGLRLGKLQAKVGICSVLQNHEITLNEKTKLPIEYEAGFILSVVDGVLLNIKDAK